MLVAVGAAVLVELVAVAASGWEVPGGALSGFMALLVLLLPVLAFSSAPASSRAAAGGGS